MLSPHHPPLTRLMIFTLAALFAASCTDQTPTSPEAGAPDGAGLAPATPNFSVAGGASAAAAEEADYHLVVFGGSEAGFTAAVESLGGTVNRVHSEIGVAQVMGLDDAAAVSLAAAADIGSVTRDFLVQWIPGAENFTIESVAAEGHVVGDPTTATFFPCQWNMTQIDCEAAWAQGEFGNPNVKVAVLDTGTDPNHIDLAGQIDVANSTSFVSVNNPFCLANGADDVTFFNDFNFHGSFVSGIIAGNGFAVTGVAPDTKIVGVKVLNCLGGGSFSDIIAGILYAASLPDVDVINMSLGARFPKNAPGGGPLMASLNAAVNFAHEQGLLVVSSAGNNGVDLDHDRNFVNIPAQSGAGISAWAGDIDGGLASYSNHGRSGTWVGAGGGDSFGGSSIPLPSCALPAFGHDGIVSVCSTTSIFFPGCAPGNFVLFNATGTSFSAPLVSGVAALVDGKANGALDGGRIKTILSQTADDIGRRGVDNLFSHGRVNAGNAVQ